MKCFDAPEEFEPDADIEPQAYSKHPALGDEEPKVEKLNYAVQAQGIDFGTLDAPNQFNSKIINPLRDMIMASLKKDRFLRGGPGSGQRYTVSLVVTAEWDVDQVN